MKSFFLAFTQILKDMGIDVIIILAGFCGGYVFINKSAKLTRLQKVSTILSGGLTANYLTPVVADWFNLSDNILGGIAFLLGYSGLKGVELIFIAFKSKINTSK
ncbi:hypothetical protein ACX0HA_08915 [Flavobacterium hauense]